MCGLHLEFFSSFGDLVGYSDDRKGLKRQSFSDLRDNSFVSLRVHDQIRMLTMLHLELVSSFWDDDGLFRR